MAARFSLALLAFLILPAFAQAQQLQRLHVKSFTLTSDTAHPKVEVPFNVTLTIRLGESVASVQNVYLPTFIGPEELGDVREQSSGPFGTIYRETLRLVAHARGPLTIGSGYLEAIDARDGKPKRFISNDLQLFVDGNSALDGARPARTIAWAALLALLGISAFVTFRRLRKPAPAVIEPADVPEAAAPIIHLGPSEFEAALSNLRARRDRVAVLRLRSALWRIAGVAEGATLAGVLRAHEADRQLCRLLVAVEHAAFIDDRGLDAAIDAVLTHRQGSPV